MHLPSKCSQGEEKCMELDINYMQALSRLMRYTGFNAVLTEFKIKMCKPTVNPSQ